MDPFAVCEFPDCKTPPVHMHHIVYDEYDEDGKEWTVPLCRKHHEDITIINGAKARATRSGWNWRYQQYRKLTNWERWEIYDGWIMGRFKPKRTKKALAYLKNWDRFDPAINA